MARYLGSSGPWSSELMVLFDATVLDAWKRLEAQVEFSRRRLDHLVKGFVLRREIDRLTH